MKKQLITAVTMVLLTSIWGCGINTRQQMLNAGQKPLDAQALYTLVADHNLRLTAIDFDAQVYFQEKSRLSALSRSGDEDSGKWDITSDNLLCLQFKHWYFGAQKCYSVFPENPEGPYMFFTENGARYYKAELLATIPEKLQKDGVKKKRSSYLKQRESSSSENPASEETVSRPAASEIPAPEPTGAEMKHLLATTARNCPACNFAGADLSSSDLTGAKLAGAHFTGADLHGANLRQADLRGADLQQADLRGANLPFADLTGCNLTDADLTGANLTKAKLTGANLKGAILRDVLREGTTGIK